MMHGNPNIKVQKFIQRQLNDKIIDGILYLHKPIATSDMRRERHEIN